MKLFPDAEVGEDVGEDVVGGDVADDVGEVVDALTDVFGHEVGGETVGEARTDATQGFEGMEERFLVTGVGDDDVVLRQRGDGGYLQQTAAELR